MTTHYPQNINSDFWCELNPPIELDGRQTDMFICLSFLSLECEWYNVVDQAVFIYHGPVPPPPPQQQQQRQTTDHGPTITPMRPSNLADRFRDVDRQVGTGAPTNTTSKDKQTPQPSPTTDEPTINIPTIIIQPPTPLVPDESTTTSPTTIIRPVLPPPPTTPPPQSPTDSVENMDTTLTDEETEEQPVTPTSTEKPSIAETTFIVASDDGVGGDAWSSVFTSDHFIPTLGNIVEDDEDGGNVEEEEGVDLIDLSGEQAAPDTFLSRQLSDAKIPAAYLSPSKITGAQRVSTRIRHQPNFLILQPTVIAAANKRLKRLRRQVRLNFQQSAYGLKRGYYTTAQLLTHILPRIFKKIGAVLETDHAQRATKVYITLPRGASLTIPHHVGRLIGFWNTDPYVTIKGARNGPGKSAGHMLTDEDPWREIFITCDIAGAGLMPELFPGIIGIARAVRNHNATVLCAPTIPLRLSSRIHRIHITLRNRFNEPLPIPHRLQRSPLIGLDFLVLKK